MGRAALALAKLSLCINELYLLGKQRLHFPKGVDVVVYDETLVEPTDRSFHQAIQFAKEARVDGFVSIGGGSVMDTCKVKIVFVCAFVTACAFDEPDHYLHYTNVGGKPVH